MSTRTVGIIMNGVTGRMGMNQHLMRSIVPIIAQGGVKAGKDTRIMPEPLLVGRNAEKLEGVARAAGHCPLDHGPRRGAFRPRHVASTSTRRRRCSGRRP